MKKLIERRWMWSKLVVWMLSAWICHRVNVFFWVKSFFFLCSVVSVHFLIDQDEFFRSNRKKKILQVLEWRMRFLIFLRSNITVWKFVVMDVLFLYENKSLHYESVKILWTWLTGISDKPFRVLGYRQDRLFFQKIKHNNTGIAYRE